MVSRVNKKFPLFADQAIEKNIAAKPDYFDPEKIAQADVIREAAIKKAQHDMDMQYVDS